jgi:AraC-like DNA-binding protein
MMSDWLLVAGGIGVFNALFLGIVLLLFNSSPRNRLLGVLFLAISIRTGKSLGILFFQYVPGSVVGIGLIGMCLAGPLLYLYFRTANAPQFQLARNTYWHFLLSGATAILLLFNSEALTFWLYAAAAAQLAIYIALSMIIFRDMVASLTAGHKKWLSLLLGSITLHWALYTSQLFIETPGAYLTVTLASALTMYLLLYGVLKWQKVLSPPRQSVLDADKALVLKNRLERLMENDQLFKAQDLNVSKLAQHLRVKPYVVSNVLKASFDKTFPEFINEYRVKEATRLLQSPQHDIFSIEAIAFDCGFNTPSAFYAAFKRYTTFTPGEFRQRRHHAATLRKVC